MTHNRKKTPNERKQMTVLARFNEKFVVGKGGCWEWIGSSTGGAFSYGKFWMDGVYMKAHRAAYTLFVGSIPKDLCVLHRCDNPSCVNPDHLFEGTKLDNSRDMINKGRGGQWKNPPRGSKRKDSKLTESQVVDIRKRCAGGESQGSVAKLYGVVQPTIHKIVHRIRWAHI